jgi:hypothetical protein
LNPLILNSSDIKAGRKFPERLKERRAELRRALEARKEVIWPIVLAHEDHLLIDGHCRYSTLKEMSIPEICCYVDALLITEPCNPFFTSTKTIQGYTQQRRALFIGY